MGCPHILIIEDVASVAMTYAGLLEKAGYKATIVSTGAAAIAELTRSHRSSQAGGANEGEGITAVMLDLNLPDTDGLTLFMENVELFSRTPVIVATADGTLPRASEAVRQGAFDYLIKPVSPERLIKTMAGAIAVAPALKMEAAKPEWAIRPNDIPDTERSPAMKRLRQDVAIASRTKAPALIFGEMGSGRRRCAARIHESGGRSDNRFIVVNCRDRIGPTLEEEIFGIVADARPGVIANRIGALHLANGGTVYFDGIDKAPPTIQLRILEYIETGAVKRVGSNRAEEVDARVIGGADEEIHASAQTGNFNQGLYYALVGYPLRVPPLRERREDIIPLANHFIEQDRELGSGVLVEVDDSMLEGWSEYDWPGNLVELAHVVRRLASSLQYKKAEEGQPDQHGNVTRLYGR